MTATIPAVDPADSSDTRWALETARTLWGQGERREALQWVRRAAEAAAESGSDSRALVLAKVGAELRVSIDMPRTLPPPPAPQTPDVVIAKPSTVPDSRRDSELVVTVVSTDGSIPAPNASFVSHRAVRVAVTQVSENSRELVVRRLADGEVAPKDSTVALLVAFEPGVSPVRG